MPCTSVRPTPRSIPSMKKRTSASDRRKPPITRVASASIRWPAFIAEVTCSLTPSVPEAKSAGGPVKGPRADAARRRLAHISARTAPAHHPKCERAATGLIFFSFCAFVPSGRRAQAAELRARPRPRTSR